MSSSTTGDASSTVAAAHRGLLALGRCRVLEIGDSLGEDLGWGLSRELAATHGLQLIMRDATSTGLSASWYYNWPRHLEKYLAKHHSNLVLIMFGANDEQPLAVNGRSEPFGSPLWRIAYTARVRDIVAIATKADSYVLWVGVPIVEPPVYRKGIQMLNAIYQQVASTTPGVTFQPTWNLLATRGGQYRGSAWVNNVLSAVRALDGIHLTYVGQNVVATFVTRQMATIYHVKLKPLAPAYINP